jgi:zinc transport system permease protein
LLEIDQMLGVFAVVALVSLALVGLQRQRALPTDALLGILAHSTLALGLVLIALMSWVRMDLAGYLFGDILAVSPADIGIVWGGGVAILALLALVWRPLLAGTVSAEIAEAEDMRPERANLVFMVLLAAVVAIAMKIVGIVLITSLLIIPAATARRFAATPEAMALAAAALGVAAVTGGLYASLGFDTPSGPSIVTAAFVLFVASLVPAVVARALKPRSLKPGATPP